MSEWKMMDTAPRDGTSILSIISDPYPHSEGEYMEVIWWLDCCGIWNSEGSLNLTPTYWMPLPQKPTTAEKIKINCDYCPICGEKAESKTKESK